MEPHSQDPLENSSYIAGSATVIALTRIDQFSCAEMQLSCSEIVCILRRDIDKNILTVSKEKPLS